jgi:hypothetical protein
MPKTKYNDIYKNLKEKIENNYFKYLDFLPVENDLIKDYECSRNTLRRAVAILVKEGYLQTMQGKGVRNIYRKMSHKLFKLNTIETFKESAARTAQSSFNKVVLFTEVTCSENFAKRSGFRAGDELYYIQRVHYMDGRALILNHNYFLKSAVGNLSNDIAEHSIYEYLENNLGMNIVNSKRIITVEKADEIDEKYLNLNIEEYNCLAVVSSFTYNSEGIMFEYTVSRHKPDCFSFSDNAVRRNSP